MQSGQIMVGTHEGVYIIKLIGDVRLDLCTTFDSFTEDMIGKDDFAGVAFDLHEAQGIDSTTLGLIAKIAMHVLEHGCKKPLVFCSDQGIRHLFDAMGFDALVEISDERQKFPGQTTLLVPKAPDECGAREKVLEAHRILMSMNERNAETFRDLVHTLEWECELPEKSSSQP